MLRGGKASSFAGGLVCVLAGLIVCPTAVTAAPAKRIVQATANVLPTNCPDKVHTPAAVDSSEHPKPGSTVPAPPPVPPKPVGGKRMGGCSYVLPEGAPELPKGLRFQSWVIFDVRSGEVLAARDPHARLRPASLAKMLLALTVVRELPSKLVVTGTQADANAEGTRVGIGPGGKYTLDQLLHGLLMHSGNDIAHALTMQLGGRAATLAKENALARALGALDTQIESPSGLDAPGMCTSAYDLSVIFREVLRNPYLAQILHTAQFPFPGYGDKPGFMVVNDNRLLTRYPGDLGGKTGYTDDATHTYANAAIRNGREIGLIMMHNDNALAGMWRNGRQLMDYGFALVAAHTKPVGLLVDTNPLQASAAPTPTPAVAAPHHDIAAATTTGGGLARTPLALAVLGLIAVCCALGWSWRRRPKPGRHSR